MNKLKIQCSNNRTDNYAPGMVYTVRINDGEDRFVYTFEYANSDDMEFGLKLTKAKASDEAKEPKMRAIAHQKAQAYYFKKVEQFYKDCEKGLWD